jgi:hypothetical protein
VGRSTDYFWEDLQVVFGKTYTAWLGGIAERGQRGPRRALVIAGKCGPPSRGPELRWPE